MLFLDDAGGNKDTEYDLLEDEEYLTFDEFVRYRDEFCFSFELLSWYAFVALLEELADESVEADDGVVAAASAALKPVDGGLSGIHNNSGNMQPYWRWVLMMYGMRSSNDSEV